MLATVAAPGPARRRALLMLSLLGALAACAPVPAPVTDFRPLTYDYLTKLRLNVASIDIDTTWTPKLVPGAVHVEAQAPVAPADALRRMAQDRLIPVGNSGHAVFYIDNASIVQFPDHYEGDLSVHLDISTSDGVKSGYAEARVTRTRTVVDGSAAGVRTALYDLTRAMLDDMNVEFEFQARRSLRDYLQSGEQTAPPPAPVEQQDLSGSAPAVAPSSPQPASPEPAGQAPTSLAPTNLAPPTPIATPAAPPAEPQ